MVHRYYRYDDMGAMAPKFPGSFENSSANRKNRDNTVREEMREEPKSNENKTAKTPALMPFSEILKGDRSFDDILLIFLIVMLMRSEEKDLPLILALGYIFLSKGDL